MYLDYFPKPIVLKVAKTGYFHPPTQNTIMEKSAVRETTGTRCAVSIDNAALSYTSCCIAVSTTVKKNVIEVLVTREANVNGPCMDKKVHLCNIDTHGLEWKSGNVKCPSTVIKETNSGFWHAPKQRKGNGTSLCFSVVAMWLTRLPQMHAWSFTEARHWH